MTMTWEHGRQLASLQTADNSVSYKYDSNGMRTQKTDNSGTTYYYYDSNHNLIGLTKGNDTLLFYYDSNGSATSFKYNGTMYYYIKNLQGDIVKIINQAGTEVAGYVYDAWGNIKSTTGNSNLKELNPFRYRGYVYDEESSLYHLQSRYYDPFTGRFLNADVLFDTQSGTPLSTNMFAYCENDPVNKLDLTGNFGTPIQWACAALGGVLGVLFGDSIARSFGLSPKKNPVKYWLVRAAVIVGGAAIGYLIGTGIIKLVSIFVKANPTITIKLVQKLGIKTTTKIMNTFNLNFLKYMKAGTLINFVANWFSSPSTKIPLSFAKLLLNACKSLGIKVVYHSGHNGTKWNMPHLHLGNHKGHLALASEAIKWVKSFLGVR